MFPLDIPIVLQDGIVAALFVFAAGFLLYKKLRKKSKSCPACKGSCTPASNLPAAPGSTRP
ncbi:MAG: FeoB-associated Cys-rich membrane protein [candidate division Zixibacteria bacterium]|nr:FeoB-associated Cys-rich membrane protein [candidate division Zixibacteria bacterium]